MHKVVRIRSEISVFDTDGSLMGKMTFGRHRNPYEKEKLAWSLDMDLSLIHI